MLRHRLIKLMVLALPLVISLAAVFVAAQDDPDVEAKIENAMSAAPMAIALDATILDVNADGEIIELRPGSNGWSCFPDNPGSPGNDPICMDEMFMIWNDALFL